MSAKRNEKLKIGMLSFYYPHLGGSGIVTARLAKHLSQDGHDVHFIGYDSDSNPKDMVAQGVKLHRVKRVDYPCLKSEPYVWSLASQATRVAEREGLDLLHANYAVPHALSAYLAREALKTKGKHLPYVVTGHGSDIHTNGAKDEINPILRLALNGADALTYVSKDLQSIAKDVLGVDKDGRVIPNFVDTDIFAPGSTGLRNELDIPQDAFVVGHVSNFAPVKQTGDIADVASNMRGANTLHNVYFLMVGDGEHRSVLEREVERRGLSGHFIFRGRRLSEEVVSSYRVMDSLILPSKHEGNPLTLLEAMACETPVVGYDVGGVSETIGAGGGFLVPNRDGAAMGSQLSKLKADKALRERVGREARKNVMEKFSVSGVMSKYLDVFREVVERGAEN